MDHRLRIGIFALVLVVLAALAGCGGASPAPEPVETPPEASAAPAPNPPAPAAPPEEPAPKDETIHVGTAGEFLEAIAPGAVIELAPGVYNLTEYLHGASDNVSAYVARGFTDGWQAEIHGVDGLTIRGAEGGKVEIVAEPRYSNVLCFKDSSDIQIENVTLGHTIEQGNCQGAVLGFDSCRNVTLDGLDLYGCGTYGVAAEHTDGLALTGCIIRDCSYGIIDLSSCGDAVLKDCTLRDNRGFDMLSVSDSSVLFDGCAFTENEGDSFLPSYNNPGTVASARFVRCTFGQWESRRFNEERKNFESDAIVDEDCNWADVAEDSDDLTDSENAFQRVALDTTRIKVVSFDAKVLMGDEYYICYEIVNRQTGDVSFEIRDDVRFLTFGEDGRGCFWTDNEKGRPFSYAMDSDYSCAVTFDDGGRASVGLYADQGGALPVLSEEGHIWLALYLDGEVIWCY